MKRYVFNILALFWICSFIFFAIQKIWCYDVWWHLATGKYIWTHKIPHTDPFSYTFYGKNWIDSLWLFQAVLYKAYQFAGYPGIVGLKFFILALAFLFLWLAFRETGADVFASLALLFVVLIAASYRFMCRPHLLGFMFIAFFWWRLIRFSKTHSFKALLPLAPAIVLWANTHGSFIIGLFLVGIFLLQNLLEYGHLPPTEVLKKPEIIKLFNTLLALCFLTFLNPYGYKLIKFVIFSHHGNASDALRYIGEWQPTPWKLLFTFIWNRDLFFKILFWLVIILLILKFINRKFEFVAWGIFVGSLTYLSIKYLRFWGLFSFSVAPLILLILKDIEFKYLKNCNILLIILSVIFIVYFCKNFNKQIMGFDVFWSKYPKNIVNFMKREKFPKPIFNSYGFGGFLIWNLFPHYKVFIDGRTPSLYSPEFYWKYRLAESGKEIAIEKLLAKYNFKTVLTTNVKMVSVLTKKFNFALVGFDDHVYLLVSKKYINPPLREIIYIEPDKKFDELLRETKTQEIEKELNYILKTLGPSAKVLNYLGTIYSDYYKQPEKAIEFFTKALEYKKNDSNILFNLGLNYEKLNDYKKAVFYLKKCINIAPHHRKAWFILGEVYYKQKKYKKALKCFLKHKKINGDNVSQDFYNYLALTYNELYDLDNALIYFKRYLFLSKTPNQKKFALYNIGSVYLAMEKYKEALLYLKKCLEIDPNYLKARKAINEIEERKLKYNK